MNKILIAMIVIVILIVGVLLLSSGKVLQEPKKPTITQDQAEKLIAETTSIVQDVHNSSDKLAGLFKTK